MSTNANYEVKEVGVFKPQQPKFFAREKLVAGDIGNAQIDQTGRQANGIKKAPYIGQPVVQPVLGCDLTGDDVHALPALRDAIIVIGSEGRGLSPAVAALVTRRITISRYGAAESLNAATAAAIVCDNLRRLHPGISGQHA